MKIKSKLILAATSLLVLSGVAAGTSTFAWFTANQAATITASQVNVETNTDNLKITASAVADFDADSDNSDFAAAFTTTSTLTDVSGNGVKLYRGSVTDGAFTSSIAVENFQAPYCFNFTITFSHTDITDGNALAIFLSSDSAISAYGSDTSTLYGGARVALLNDGDDASLAYYAPNDDTAKLTTILTDAGYSGPGTAIDATSLDLSANHTQNILTNDSFTTDYNDSTVGAANAAKGYIGTITGDESLTIHARIFLEGQDLDTSNENVGGSFDTSLIFNGVSENLDA